MLGAPHTNSTLFTHPTPLQVIRTMMVKAEGSSSLAQDNAQLQAHCKVRVGGELEAGWCSGVGRHSAWSMGRSVQDNAQLQAHCMVRMSEGGIGWV